ncbi:hypothetical protein OAJ04_01450 [Candidatus Nitrosopelagicus sp.]|mgnify:FL=1|nr:hypothetical protein [Candidatus Nitrosopelagicus sp.]|tara:strand:+ start:276 stop:659 length:384 start_codon:yes stop_codon:yes gene_type:complete
MNENELQEIVEKSSSDFKIIIEDKSFIVDEIKMHQTDNPITEPTTRGGVYFAEMKEWRVEATIFDTSISKHLSKAMLGPNKDFLDITLHTIIENGQKILLVTNLKNSMQNASKIILYLTLKDAIIES